MKAPSIAGLGRTIALALLTMPVATIPAGAQQSGSAPMQEGAQDAELDQPVAAVGDAQITRQDVADAISGLPAQMRQQPAETLVPAVVNQLVSRELILRAARDEGLAEDPTVAERAGADAGEIAQENAMVQFYLERALQDAVSDEAVQATYDAARQQADSELPPLESVRPQIERQLRMEAFGELRSDLAQDVSIVFYDSEGAPQEVEMTPQGPMVGGAESQ